MDTTYSVTFKGVDFDVGFAEHHGIKTVRVWLKDSPQEITPVISGDTFVALHQLATNLEVKGVRK